MNCTLPLFPLHTVLFPGGRLDLRIFEPRYLDMVRDCLRAGGGFGVCLIREGREAGPPARFAEIGTSARIVDWAQRTDGLLGITAVGERRFRVVGSRVQPDNLVLGDVQWLPEPVCAEIGPEHAWLRELFEDSEMTIPDAAALAFRIAESVPLSPALRQELLEIDAPLARLDRMEGMLQPLLAAASRREPG
jgi:hypothetical protein